MVIGMVVRQRRGASIDRPAASQGGKESLQAVRKAGASPAWGGLADAASWARRGRRAVATSLARSSMRRQVAEPHIHPGQGGAWSRACVVEHQLVGRRQAAQVAKGSRKRACRQQAAVARMPRSSKTIDLDVIAPQLPVLQPVVADTITFTSGWALQQRVPRCGNPVAARQPDGHGAVRRWINSGSSPTAAGSGCAETSST